MDGMVNDKRIENGCIQVPLDLNNQVMCLCVSRKEDPNVVAPY
jgi:hypothetical protein